ncbi:MAG: fibrillarin-like rRNA/tRNA 2'-O-methyltransferase [Thermoplasmata archaeon]|nr:fibrillarin-like rRNA/tRNA 2'-O-methyltransferase [Thermoplasmata archaeon]
MSRPDAAAEWPGIYRVGSSLYTRNAAPGVKLRDEALISDPDGELRKWDPWRSKLAAYIVRGGTPLPLDQCRRMLYLGGGHGTTASHLAEAAPEATIAVVEKSPMAFAALLDVARVRKNLWPILADAQLPERYAADAGPVDLLYQDVAQRNQSAIFADNAAASLAPGGVGLLMLKVRSVTQRQGSSAIVAETRRILADRGFALQDSVDLSPFARDHVAIHAVYR